MTIRETIQGVVCVAGWLFIPCWLLSGGDIECTLIAIASIMALPFIGCIVWPIIKLMGEGKGY